MDPGGIKPEPVKLGLIVGEVTLRAFHPLPDDNPCYALIGLVAAEQARIEHMLDVTIWELGEIDPAVGACITGQMMGMYGRYFAMLQLASYRAVPAAMIKEITQLQNKSGSLADLRNRIIHDPWLEDTSTGGSYQFKSKAKRDTRYGPEPVTEADLKSTLASFRSHYGRVLKLRSDVWALMRA